MFQPYGTTSVAKADHFGDHANAIDAVGDWANQRYEGNDAGNRERLCKGNKTLESEPQERIRNETSPVGKGRKKRHEVEKT